MIMNTDVQLIIIMGVSGSGKSSVAKNLAKALGYSYLDADDFHNAEAKRLMAKGKALSDLQREQWLHRMISFFSSPAFAQTKTVFAFSGLKQRHRRLLNALELSTQFIFLHGKEQVIARRINDRNGHFFPVHLLKSQFDALDCPISLPHYREELDITLINIEKPLKEITKAALDCCKVQG
jgi:gluconokinase